MVLTKLSHLAKVIGGRRKPDVDERASLEGAALGDHRSRDPLPTGENVPQNSVRSVADRKMIT